MTTYLRIRNWEKFQHYKNRRPPWIKFYVELLDDYELTAQPIGVQLVYDRLLLLAAKHENLIPNDGKWIAKQTKLDANMITTAIETLLQGAWLSETKNKRRASKTLAARKQNAMPETETDKDPPTPTSRSKSNGKSPRANRTNARAEGTNPRNQKPDPLYPCPHCHRDQGTAEELAEHAAHVHGDYTAYAAMQTTPPRDPDADIDI